MKSLRIPLFVILSLLFIGCSSDDDDSGTDPPNPTPIARLVADTLVIAPMLDSVDEATWNNVDSASVQIGGDAANYGKDLQLGTQNVSMKAIKTSDTIYILVKWHDRNANIWGNYLRKHNDDRIWESVTSMGQDLFTICLYAPDSGSDSGSVDIWEWMSTATAPGRMAEDRWKTPIDSISDFTLNYYVYRANLKVATEPVFMHVDTTDFAGPYLYLDDTTHFRYIGIDWLTNYRMPGYLIDTTIFNLATRGSYSRWDVKAISHFDSLPASMADYTWTVVFSRALNTTHAEDLDISGMDSVKISIIGDNNSNSAFTPDYSGSAPFWLILKP